MFTQKRFTDQVGKQRREHEISLTFP